MVLSRVSNFLGRSSVANGLPEFSATLETSITYRSFQNPPLVLGVSKTPLMHEVFKTLVNAWDSKNPVNV